MREELIKRVRAVGVADFEEVALMVYSWQIRNNPVYREYVDLLGRLHRVPKQLSDIPFLPISLFKSHHIQTGIWTADCFFTSSGTTGKATSRHPVLDLRWYDEVCRRCFESVYGPLSDWTILALLPSYLEREGSSLVRMARHFIEHSAGSPSGFFLNDLARLSELLKQCRTEGRQTLLIGVSFALLDLAEKYPQDLSGITIMETGGMKGRRRELTRSELHGILREALNVQDVHSEYGMTELFSQAYAPRNGIFIPGHSMSVLPRQITDPLSAEVHGRTAALNIIDLSNIDSCAFIATDDLGRCASDGTFEVLGRMDGSDIRGCNLMVANLEHS